MPTEEMKGLGFATNDAYDATGFTTARQANEIIEITSAVTGTRYGLQIRPVFDSGTESVGQYSTDATIIAVNGGRLMSLMNVSVTLKKTEAGTIRVDINRR